MATNRLDTKFETARKEGKGIISAFRKAPDETPFDTLVKGSTKIGQGVLGVLDRINSSGSKRSPSTVRDRRMPNPK